MLFSIRNSIFKDNKINRNVRRHAQRFGRVQGVDLELFFFGVVLKLKSFLLTFTGGNANVVLPDARPMVKLIGNMHRNEFMGMLKNQNRIPASYQAFEPRLQKTQMYSDLSFPPLIEAKLGLSHD